MIFLRYRSSASAWATKNTEPSCICPNYNCFSASIPFSPHVLHIGLSMFSMRSATNELIGMYSQTSKLAFIQYVCVQEKMPQPNQMTEFLYFFFKSKVLSVGYEFKSLDLQRDKIPLWSMRTYYSSCSSDWVSRLFMRDVTNDSIRRYILSQIHACFHLEITSAKSKRLTFQIFFCFSNQKFLSIGCESSSLDLQSEKVWNKLVQILLEILLQQLGQSVFQQQ